MDLLKKKKKTEAQTVSDENTAMLPENKKSKSDLMTQRTNKFLVFIGIGMLVIFVIGAILMANKNVSKISSVEKQVDTQTEKKKQDDIPYLPPVVSIEPESIKIENQLIGEDAFNQIIISVLNNPIKITNISSSYNIDGLSLETEDCTSRTKITANSSCTINLTWLPKKKENKSLFIIIKYDTLENDTVKTSEEKKISVSLRSVEPAPPPAPVEEDEFFDDFEEDGDYEIDEDIAPETEMEEDIVETTIPVKPKRTVMPDDCKKYASKAYDFSGTFIGWVQGNNDVFAPNCSKIIGTMQEDGMVMETGTGRIIGKGTVLDKKKSEEKRIELALPLLEETMQSVDKSYEPNFEEVMSNRQLVKGGEYNERRTTIGDDEDIWRLNDKLGIYENEQKKLIPFTIIATDQLSSMPKDERYVLRQSKPIPAVLNRPIYFSSDVANDQDITATVERNVFGGDGRTIIIPAGSQLIGVATHPGDVGIQAVQKISIEWNRLTRPDGAEFDLGAVGNYSADAQGRAGVPGKNDTGYMQQLFVKPLLYSALPVALESLFPSTSNLVTRVKRSDGTYNTIDEVTAAIDGDGADDFSYAWNDMTYELDMSSKDKIKAEIQQNFKSVMQKLIEDSAKQTIPFTVPSGTRIQVFLNKDIMLRINDEMEEILTNANEHLYEEDSFTVGERTYSTGAEGASGATTLKSGFTTTSGAVSGASSEEEYEE